MPELPEVEHARRTLTRWLVGRRVVDARAEDTRVFRGANRRDFEAIRGGLRAAERRGKYLLLEFDDDRGLLAHLGMTGKLVLRPREHDEPYSRARLYLDDGQVIHFRDPRMFGRIEPAPASALRRLPVIEKLGRDPLVDGLTGSSLREALGSSRQPLKVALMDQERLAGLGNIHAAEALFRARLHPARQPASLSAREWARLADAIEASITFALSQPDDDELTYVEEPGAPNPFLVYGRASQRCGRCGSIVRSFVQAGRTTHYCPKCQPRRRWTAKKTATRKPRRRA